MHILQYTRRTVLSASCLILLFICIQASSATAAIAAPANQQMQVGHAQSNPEAARLLQLKQSGRLAKTVNVLNSLPPTTILQFHWYHRALSRNFPTPRVW